MDHYTLAAASLTGISLDVLGGLYLAYDLLGGKHGPLRLLTRIVTYSIVFGIGFGIGLGPLFGIIQGVATGITIAIELHRTSSKGDHYPLPWEAAFSVIRGIAFASLLYRRWGIRFAFTFGILLSLFQVFAYWRGVRPSLDYAAARGSRLTRRQLWGVIYRTIGAIASAAIASALTGHLDTWPFAIRLGITVGIVTTVGTMLNPYIEYYADSLPERRLGVFGIALVFLGFALQSMQYWLSLLDIPVT